jgi:choice-of-anchor A domain-containing protein
MKFVPAVALALSIAPVAAVHADTVLTDYNLVVGGNLDSNSEVEGRTLVGGNLAGQNWSNYATRLTPSGDFSNVNSLVVGGNATASFNLQAGDARIGGNRTGNVNLNGAGSQVFANDASATSIANSVIPQMLSLSNGLRSLAADSTVSPLGSQPAAVRFTATPGADNIAVFAINGSVFSDSRAQQYELLTGAANANTTFVINVSGTTVRISEGNFVSAFSDLARRANIIWNFFEATSLEINQNLFGAVLAPVANLQNSTAIEGSVFVGGNFTQRGEVHLPLYRGSPPPVGTPAAVVPVPAAVLAGPALLGLLALARRR